MITTDAIHGIEDIWLGGPRRPGATLSEKPNSVQASQRYRRASEAIVTDMDGDEVLIGMGGVHLMNRSGISPGTVLGAIAPNVPPAKEQKRHISCSEITC